MLLIVDIDEEASVGYYYWELLIFRGPRSLID